MNDTPDPWINEVDADWRRFGAQLADRLDALESGETLSLASGSSDAPPYLRFAVLEGKGVLAEALGNDGTGGRRLDSREFCLLSKLGWFRLPDESEPAVTHWSVAGSASYDELAATAGRTLREVFGVLHPTFLTLEHTADAVEHVARPASHVELARMVDAALVSVLGEPSSDGRRDDHSDIAIVTGSTVVQIGVADDARSVDVYAVLVRDVPDRARALAEINILNRDPAAPTYTYRNHQVLVRQRIPARPFVPTHLREAVVAALGRYDELADDLVCRIGGRRWFSEPDEVESPSAPVDDEGTATPARLRLRTLMHLEADQPGSVEPRLAAHIFDYDAHAILGQINWLRNDGRVALVPLLRQALRVIVEDDRERSAR